MVIDRIYEALATSTDSRAIARLAQVVATLEGQNQTDELQLEKNKRLDEGKPTEATVNLIADVGLVQRKAAEQAAAERARSAAQCPSP